MVEMLVICFFRVANENPRGLVKVDTIATEDQVIKILPLSSYDGVSSTFLVSDLSGGEFRILSRDDLLCLEYGVQAWSRLPDASYSIPDLAVSDRLALCRALTEMKSVTDATTADDPDATSFNVSCDDRYTAIMAELDAASIIVKVSESTTVTSWRWDPAGKQRLQLVWELSRPRPLCSPHKARPIRDMSILDLVQCLKDNKWRTQLWDKEKERAHGKQPPPIRVSTGSPKVWWIQPNRQTVSKPYVLALLQLNG